MTVAASGKKNDLLYRIELILGIHNKKGLSFNKLAGLLAALLCVIAINALLIMSKPESNDLSIRFSKLSSPLYLFTAENKNETPEETITEKQSLPVINHSNKAEVIAKSKRILHSTPAIASPIPPLPPGFVQVNYEPVEMPELKNYQEEQVKEAMVASKKILENAQWKAVEKTVADVLTQKEKEQLKATYQKELNKIDWNKLEDRLRLAYDKLDWDKINNELSIAVNRIRLDSLQKVYSVAAGNLDKVEKQLCTSELKGIPDTDITLQEVEQKKQEVNKTLRSLRTLRSKKIVHL